MCCLIFSRRGLAYFGVLVQLLVCLLLVPLVTVPVGLTLGMSRSFSGRDLSGMQTGFVVVYSCGMCFTATLIFRGIRKESVMCLSTALLSLLLLQTLSAAVTLVSWSNKSPSGRVKDQRVLLLRVLLGLLNLTTTGAYATLLLTYVRVLRLAEMKKGISDDESNGSSEESYGMNSSTGCA